MSHSLPEMSIVNIISVGWVNMFGSLLIYSVWLEVIRMMLTLGKLE